MIRSDGPADARIMIVGEAPGETEILKGLPFVGASGQELSRMLHEAGIARSQCFLTNVCRVRPAQNNIEFFIPKKKSLQGSQHSYSLRDWKVSREIIDGMEVLKREIELVKPNIIIAFGNVALYALTGKSGIGDWRGSMLQLDIPGLPPTKVLPSYHPAYILRMWNHRPVVVNDLRRAAAASRTKDHKRPEWKFIVRPSFQTAFDKLKEMQALAGKGLLPLAVDIETRAGHIACVGFAWNKLEAICIPLMCVERKSGYWSEEEETTLMWELMQLLIHPNCSVIGQNFLYDAQYFYRHLLYIPNVKRDTMITQHTCWSNMEKALDFLASLYCADYAFWKNDGKEWDKKLGEDSLWIYNCEDCVRTFEVDAVQQPVVDSLGVRAPHNRQQAMFWPVLQAMIDGVLIDQKARAAFAMELQDEISKREQWFIDVLGHPLNPRSSPQMQKLFYDDFKQRPIFNRKTKKYTLDDDALVMIARREPLLKPLIMKIAEYRTLGVFFGTFVSAPLDRDGRMRCSYNIAKTKTYRLSSSKNAFGTGMNMQNIPSDETASSRDMEAATLEGLELPNVRKLFIPDPGHVFFDIDLSKADLRIVTWEADEKEMKAMLKEGRDPYLETAREHFKNPAITKTSGPEYNIFKSFAHGTHYLGTAAGLAGRLGLTVHEVDRTQKWYFGKYPGIKKWQKEVKQKLLKQRWISNVFGYKIHVIDRIDESLFKEMIAWIPQSTIGILINIAWQNLFSDSETRAKIQVLLQTHDSLSGQFRAELLTWAVPKIKAHCEVLLPYPDPLIIPVGVKVSDHSWGEVK